MAVGEARQAKEKMTLKVTQVPAYVNERDYFLGYLDDELISKVVAVTLEHEKKGAESVEVICRVR